MESLARIFVLLGLIFLVLGGIVFVVTRLGIQFGRLPGDFQVQQGNITCVIALGTSLFLSLILTLILNIVVRFLNK